MFLSSRSLGIALACIAALTYAMTALGQEISTEELAKETQNPVADLISFPLQNNVNFHSGPLGQPQDVLNIQPVVPFELNDDWNLISRTILPLISQPPLMPGDDRVFGSGDLNPALFLSPAKAGSFIWGFGPTLSVPTATNKSLGSGKWSAGPGAVVLTIQGPWVIGALVNNIWSFGGPSSRSSVNQMLIQPFVNYNLPGGWYLTSSPIITANWKAPPGGLWVVPLGGGIGRVFRIEKQPINVSLAAYYNVVTPKNGANWQLRAQVQLLFPK